MTRKIRKARSECPISLALESVGDHWTLLIVRDLMFRERKTFRDFLEGGEGIATNILADRLTRLEADGIVERGTDPADRRRVIYHLTHKGIDLVPVLVEMIVWSATYGKTAAPPSEVQKMRRHRDAYIAEIHQKWRSTAAMRRIDDPAE